MEISSINQTTQKLSFAHSKDLYKKYYNVKYTASILHIKKQNYHQEIPHIIWVRTKFRSQTRK